MLTIQQLIDIKLEKKERVYKALQVPELGGAIKVKVPNQQELEEINSIEIKNNSGEVNEKASTKEKMKKIIYYQVVEPKLSDNELIKHYKCSDAPEEVVFKIMSEETAESLATAILALFDKETNKYRVRVIEEAKN